MKSKNQLLSVGIYLSILSMIILSCKKENAALPVSANNSNPTDVVAKQYLAAWYKFTNGNTADYSGNNNHLKPHNVTLAPDYLGRPNNAFFFNGNNSFLNAPNSASLNPSSKISLVALFKPTAFNNGAGATSRIFMKGDDDQSNGDYFLGFYNTGSSYGTYGDNQFQSNGVGDPNNSMQLNNWYKLVYTYDGSVGKLYINDVLVNQVAKVATFTPNVSPLRIGKTGRTDFPYWFIGVIDEIRIYNTALTAAQVSKVDLELGQ